MMRQIKTLKLVGNKTNSNELIDATTLCSVMLRGFGNWMIHFWGSLTWHIVDINILIGAASFKSRDSMQFMQKKGRHIYKNSA